MVLHQISQYIKKEKLFSKSDKIIVAISGGADSVALLHILVSLGYTCEAAHCNFHLRGEESDRDEKFVNDLCEKWNIPLHITSFQTFTYAKENKISIEMAARELRYKWFRKLCIETKSHVIATAHHLDDSVETVLINLIRGTGINGLLGIRPKNNHIVRPLLCINKDNILEYLESANQEYITDSTNFQNEFIRNKIRLEILPIMQVINPSVKENIIRTINHLHEVDLVYKESIEKTILRVKTENGISIPALQNELNAHAVLYEILYPMGFNPAQIDDIYRSINGQPGKIFTNQYGDRIIKDREELIIEKKTQENKPPFKLTYTIKDYSPGFIINKNKNIAHLDADKLEELTTRKWEKGDFFFPFGMNGKKLISNFLTDIKLPLNKKENQWVLCSGQKIAWIIGERIDNRFRIDENTKKVMIINLILTD